jgi:hypothetical protein
MNHDRENSEEEIQLCSDLWGKTIVSPKFVVHYEQETENPSISQIGSVSSIIT